MQNHFAKLQNRPPIPCLFIAKFSLESAYQSCLASYRDDLRILQSVDLMKELVERHFLPVRLAERGERLQPPQLDDAEPVSHARRHATSRSRRQARI